MVSRSKADARLVSFLCRPKFCQQYLAEQMSFQPFRKPCWQLKAKKKQYLKKQLITSKAEELGNYNKNAFKQRTIKIE